MIQNNLRYTILTKKHSYLSIDTRKRFAFLDSIYSCFEKYWSPCELVGKKYSSSGKLSSLWQIHRTREFSCSTLKPLLPRLDVFVADLESLAQKTSLMIVMLLSLI